MKKLITLCVGLFLSFGSFALTPITGTLSACVGSTSSLSDTTSGGTWSSSNVAIATVSSSGLVTPVSFGTTIITYTVGSSYATAVFTVSGTAPAVITGTTSLCVGSLSTLADATAGGVWSSSNPGVATIGSLTGVVTPVSSGYTDIEYSIGACYASIGATVGSTTIDSITGPSSVCVGSTITLSDLTTGGTWISSNPSVATVGPTTGVVTGVSTGSASISYEVSGCGGLSTYNYRVTVNSATSAGTISGSSTGYVGSTTTLSETVSGGTWSSSNTAVATVVSSTGGVTGVANGTVIITYSVTGCSGVANATFAMTISTINRISGTVNFTRPDTLTGDTLKIWLITFNTSTSLLEASDSITTILSGYSSSFPYQFMGEPTDSYRVKASIQYVTFSTTGYVPTYHTSSIYWNIANVFYHTGTADDGMDINMGYGTVSAGPGFISGNVWTGANRGTSSGIPAVGLLMYAINSSGNLVQQVYTDGTGSYNFSNLPYDTYIIYPEAINYNTTAYTSITINASTPSMTAASFMQHTKSMTITPILENVNTLKQNVSSVIAFPNPTNGKINIDWIETTNEKGNISITDMTGREVYSKALNLTEGAGNEQLNLSGLAGGLYMINIKSGTLNYMSKLEIQK